MFEVIVRHRFWVIALAIVPTAFLALQLPKLELDPDAEAYVPLGHPVRANWAEVQDSFGVGRSILVAVKAHEGTTVFTPEILAGVTRLTEGIKELDVVPSPNDVRSLADAEAMIGSADGLEVRAFFDSPPTTHEEAETIRARVFENTVYLDRLVSSDSSIAAIIINVHETEESQSTEVYHRIAQYVEGTTIEGADLLLAGTPAIEAVYGRQMAEDLSSLIPMALVAVLAILFACFRSVRGVFLPALVVVMAVVWTWGIQALLGLPIYIAGTLVPPLLLAIGCAVGIHIIERYYEKNAAGYDHDAAIVAAMQELWRPVVLTGLTTAAGFGALMAGNMTVYRVFGLTTAVGILAAMAISLTLLPALLACMTTPPARRSSSSQTVVPRAMMALGRTISHRRRTVLACGILVAGVCTVTAKDLRVDYSWVESLAPGTPVLEAERILRTRHGGTMPLSVIVRSDRPDGIKDPALLRAMDAVLSKVAQHPYVGDTRSIAEYIRRMNQAMNEDRAEELRIPDTPELVAQYLLLYSMSGDPAEFDDVVDYDYQSALLSILLRTDRMSVMDDVIALTEEALDQFVRPLGVTATVSGPAVVQKTVLDMILVSQVYSLATAAALVFLFMVLLFRSLRDASICMLPPLLTGTINFGAMALLDIPLGPEKAMISAIALGIGIDYSIHLMSRFRDVAATGVSAYDAIVETMRTTGRAILFNGIVVVAGFMVLGMSVSPSNSSFGLMIASNMAVSCLAALLILPAALTVVANADPHEDAASSYAEITPDVLPSAD